MPDFAYVELTYADTVNLASGVVGYLEHTFSLNNLFDPDVTGVGHQPLGRDEYAELYTRYHVEEAKYEVWVNNNGTAQLAVGCCATRQSNAFPSRTEAFEHPTSIIKMLAQRNLENGVYMTGTINLRDFDRYATNDLEYGAQMGTSPSKQTFLKIFCADLASGVSLDCNFIVRITYKAKVFERKNLTQS